MGLPFGRLFGKSTAPFSEGGPCRLAREPGEPHPMGKRDRRHSWKMSRRTAQEKKKIREKRPKAAKAAEAEA